MYADYYGFNSLPFQLTPDHRFFYQSSTHIKALAHLTFGMGQGEGFIVITGEVGAGKTTLLGYLLNSLDPNKYVSAAIMTSQLAGGDVVELAAMKFGINCNGLSKAALMQEFENFLIARYNEGKRCLLVVDEVQNLPMEALEELRMLSNLAVDQKSLIQSVLLAQPQFKSILSLPDLLQLRQRVIAAYHLCGLSEDETRDYICHRLETVGWDGSSPKISANAFSAIYRATNGIPRLINNLCSRILLFSCLESLTAINSKVVENVVEDLQRETAEVLDGSLILNSKFAYPERNLPSERDGSYQHERIGQLNSRMSQLEEKVESMSDGIEKLELGIAKSARCLATAVYKKKK